ncbi:MAG: peptidase S41, partial [Prevotellaceae bacterium]|nr:peptidase S41 [Prevotellaceae bacterium]
MRKYLIFIITTCIFSSCISDDEPQFINSKEGNFDALWHIIDTRYCFLDYKNINWDSIKTVYKPRLAQIQDKYALFDLFAAMLAELKDGHVNLSSEFDRSRYWKWYSDYPANFNSSIIFNEQYLGQNYRMAGGLRYAKIAEGKVGYIYYGSFSDGFSGANIVSIFQQFRDCRAIIIDVRNNGGGTLTYAEALASYFFEKDD